MKTDAELLRIWKATENRYDNKAQTEHNNLTIEEKARLFDLIVLGKHIELKGGLENG
jgi:hypothetical protein